VNYSGHPWETFLDYSLIQSLSDVNVNDCSKEQSEEWQYRLYPTYVHRDYRVFSHGSWVGYTSKDIFDNLPRSIRIQR